MIKKELHHDLDKKNKNKPTIHFKCIDQQTGSDTPKKTSFKLRLIQWLKQLPLDERYLAVKVNAPGLSKRIQETLIDLQNETIQQVKKDSSASKRISPRQAKQIIQSIVLISDGEEYFDNIGFDFSYIEHPDKLYQLLAMGLSQQQKQMFQTDQYQIETLELKEVCSIVEKCITKQQLTLTLISFLRGEIFTKYEQDRSNNLEEERNRKKQFSMFWRNLPEEYKRRILLLNKDDFGTLSTFLAERKIFLAADDLEKQCSDLLQMQKNEFCNKIFKCKLKKSLTYFTDYHELIYKLWKSELNKKKKKCRNHRNNNPQKFSNTINRSPIIQVNEKPLKRPNKNEKEQQKQKVDPTFIRRQKSNNNSTNNNLQGEKSPKNVNFCNMNHNVNQQKKTIESTIISLNQNQKNTKANLNHNTLLVPQANNQNVPSTSSKRRKNKNRRKKSVSAESKETNTTNHKFERQQKQEYERKIEEETSIASEAVIDTISSSTLVTLSTLPCTVASQDHESGCSIPSTSQQVILPQINYSSVVHQKVKNDIQQYSDLINEQANEFYLRRVIAYERIQFMLGMWKVPIKLFGSCASGITIKNSDIDIAVDNSILNYFIHLPENNRLKGALEQLEQLLGSQPWVTGLRLIKTAAIPLIKLKVNTSVKFAFLPGLEMYQPYIDSLNRDHISSGQIHIDLTIETINKELQCNHLGIISTDHINSWLKTIKSLHPIVIIIKNYLTKTNLNITYEGGLNTYSMICMLVAFIKDKKIEEEADVVKVLQQILKFYAFEFDEKTTGIDLLNEEEIFYNKLELLTTKSASESEQPKLPNLTQSKSATVFCQADLLIKDPLNNGKNMTKNCYSFPKIRQLFTKIYTACYEQQSQKLEQLFKQKFRTRFANCLKPEKLTEGSKQVMQLLEECKHKLGNPFLTLFE